MTLFLQILEWVALGTFYFFCTALIALLCGALVAPVGAVRWWTGVGYRPPGVLHGGAPDSTIPETVQRSDASHFVVYLSGIGGIGGHYLSAMEQAYLDALRARQPNA